MRSMILRVYRRRRVRRWRRIMSMGRSDEREKGGGWLVREMVIQGLQGGKFHEGSRSWQLLLAETMQ